MGSMAKIGKRNGVALLMGIRLRGFLAVGHMETILNLSTLPSLEKKFRVAKWTDSIVSI